MSSSDAEKKAKRKYQREKRKKIACDVDIDFYADVKLHADKKGYKSLNSYIIDLIKKDMEL